MPVEKFNNMRFKQWREDFRKSLDYNPDLAFYVFLNKNLEFRKKGYVKKIGKNSYVYAKTKKELK